MHFSNYCSTHLNFMFLSIPCLVFLKIAIEARHKHYSAAQTQQCNMWLCALTGSTRCKCTSLSTVLVAQWNILANLYALYATKLLSSLHAWLSGGHHACLFLVCCCGEGRSIGVVGFPASHLDIMQRHLKHHSVFPYICGLVTLPSSPPFLPSLSSPVWPLFFSICAFMGQWRIVIVKAYSHWKVIAVTQHTEDWQPVSCRAVGPDL